MATTVAGELPDTAAKMMQANIALIGKPPGKCPTIDFAKSMIRLAEPPLLSKFPAKINIGIAISENLLIPSKIICGIIAIVSPSKSVKNIIVKTVLAPSETATGTPISISAKRRINKNAIVIFFLLSL